MMKTIGEKIFAKDADGNLLSRIGTMFLRTPGLVTAKGVHAMQRLMWIDELAKEGPVSPEREAAELAESVDLIFTESQVLIRPDPDRMDLAFRADKELQKIVSKRAIRFLNTNSAKVRAALRERGENWRMARAPISQEDMDDLVAKSRVAIEGRALYYYNRATGTRYLTASDAAAIGAMEGDEFRRQVAELVEGLSKRNRHGQPEIDLFPTTTPPDVKKALKALDAKQADEASLKAAYRKINTEWRMSVPPGLRDESLSNFEWRNAICRALTRLPNDTSAEEQELIAGIAPEFYRQIEWLPGVRIDGCEVVFDPIYDEAARTQDPELLSLCDPRVKSFLFNMMRLFAKMKYVNVGRIVNPLSRRPIEGEKRVHAFIMQYLEDGASAPKVMMIRLQKWGVPEHLDEGKDILQSIVEAEEYSDYILDRRLMCRQLGMNLPMRLGYGHFTERYRGFNQYNGCTVRTAFFIRSYIPGIASDKVPASKLRNPAWARKFAFLMGEAAAIDLVVGRRGSTTGELLFDRCHEVVKTGVDSMPVEVKIADHEGSFYEYEKPLEAIAPDYAEFAKSRREMVGEYAPFAESYVEGFRRKLAETQAAYRRDKRAFDELFSDRPYDTNGSGAYRWARVLKRLDECDPDRVASVLKAAAEC